MIIATGEEMLVRKKIINGIFVAIGFLCIGIGSVGIILPMLPTTPFFLLALACFARGSTRFHKWFLSTKLYKNNLESFATSRSMTMKTKITILASASVLLILAAIMVPVLPMRIFIACLILIKYYYFLFRIKTVEEKNAASRNGENIL